MKKIISVILSVTMLCIALYVPLTVGAANLSTGEQPTYDPNYARFNDFEDESIRGFDYSNQGNFTIANTGDSNYGYAFRIANNAWKAIDGNVTSGGITLFNESLTIGKNYIMSYDYKNINASYSGTQPVSFAPKHDSFSMINSRGDVDYYDYPTFYDNTNWYKHTVGFTASQDSLNPKINTCNGVGVYMDNFLVVEAAEFKDLTGDTATVEAVEGEIVTNNKNGIANMVAKGNKLSFKVNVANSFYKSVVTHGGMDVTAVNGVYTIDKVTDDIEVTTIIDKDTLDEVVKSKFTVDASNNITFSAGDTLAKFMDDTKIVESMISLKSVNEKLRRDEVLRDGYVLSIIDDAGETIVSYTVKIDGTISEYTPDDAKIDQINNYISDTITKSGTGITADNLKNSLLNDGNRSAVANVIKKAMDGENVTIVTFGGSITYGAASTAQPSSITHTFTDTRNYSQIMGDWFKSVFGENVEVKNAGIGATDTPYAIHRMNMDVMAFNPDMVIVEWDKNDVNKDTYKQATYENMLRKFIEKGVAVVMLGLCGKNTNGDDSSIEMHVPLAEKYDLPYISYRDALGDKPEIDYSDGQATVTAPNALDLLSQGIVDGTGTSQGKQTTAIYLFAKYNAPMYAGGKTANPNKIVLDNGGVATVVSRTFYVMSKSNYDKLENKDDFGKNETLSSVKSVTSTGQQLSKYWRKSVISGTHNAETTFGVCIKNITSERKDSAFAVRAKIEYRIGNREIQTVYSNIQTANYFSAQGAYDALKDNGQQPPCWFNTDFEDGSTDADDFFG